MPTEQDQSRIWGRALDVAAESPVGSSEQRSQPWPTALDPVDGAAHGTHQPWRHALGITQRKQGAEDTRQRPTSSEPSRIRTLAASKLERFDIQGLRAVAVLLVILDHLGSWPHGGFIGVDVFFVISGFLITGLLLRAATTTRSLSAYFGQFYLRRARRILPAALVVLAVCWIAADLTFRGSRVNQNHSDILWALGFAANFHFASLGTNYFQATAAPSLVQHFWSLAVEEQFYLIWPIVLFAVVQVVNRHGARAVATRNSLLTAVSAATILSFLWAVHQTNTTPVTAYFSPVVRAWELGVGAVLAVAATGYPHMTAGLPARWRGRIAALGLLVILVSAIFVTSSPDFPAPAAAAPVLGTAMIIYSGIGTSGAATLWTLPLTNPVSRYLGNISFSLYLWHWPTIIIVGSLVNRGSLPFIFYPVAILATLALSIVSYHVVEQPARRSPRGHRRTDQLPVIKYSLLAGASLGVVALLILALKPPPPAPDFTSRVDGLAHVGLDVNKYVVSATPILSQRITSALNATSFPDLRPGLNNLGLLPAEKEWRHCDDAATELKACVTRPATPRNPNKVALVLGDSISLAYLPAINSALVPDGWTVYGFTRQQCPAADLVEKSTTPTLQNNCSAIHSAYARIARRVKPSLVVMSSQQDITSNLQDGATGAAAYLQYVRGMKKTITAMTSNSRARIVVLSPPPIGDSLTTCDTSSATPADCVASISDSWYTQSRADSSLASNTVTYVDTHQWSCNDEYCPAFVGGTPIFYDGVHLTKDFSEQLRPEMKLALSESTGH